MPLGAHLTHKLAVEHQFAGQPAKARLKRRNLRPIHALSVGQPYGFILNFWQRYASHATAVPEACAANEGHTGCSVAKLCFPIGKITVQGTGRMTVCPKAAYADDRPAFHAPSAWKIKALSVGLLARPICMPFYGSRHVRQPEPRPLWRKGLRARGCDFMLQRTAIFCFK